MFRKVRRAGLQIVALTCLLTPAVAAAQEPMAVTQLAQTNQVVDPFDGLPRVKDRFPGSGSQATPTPTPTEEPSATPTATATPEPTATAKPRNGRELAETGSDDVPILALGGLSLLGFGIALRLRLALDDARRAHALRG